MKVSVSLPDEDVQYIDNIAGGRKVSRSTVLHEAIDMLRRRGLADEYAAAYQEFESTGEAQAWDAVSGDGIGG